MVRLPSHFLSNDSSSWIHRVADNLRAAFLFPKFVRFSSNGSPLHFADISINQDGLYRFAP